MGNFKRSVFFPSFCCCMDSAHMLSPLRCDKDPHCLWSGSYGSKSQSKMRMYFLLIRKKKKKKTQPLPSLQTPSGFSLLFKVSMDLVQDCGLVVQHPHVAWCWNCSVLFFLQAFRTARCSFCSCLWHIPMSFTYSNRWFAIVVTVFSISKDKWFSNDVEVICCHLNVK